MPSSSPRFSIVIPCFNQGPFIPECLESLRAQTLAPHEIIVVNDGSTDPFTTQRLRELCRDRIVLIEQSNAGVSAARNAGIRRATGDWIVPLDGDDKLAPEALATYAAAIAREPDVDIWYPDIQHFGLDDSLHVSPETNGWKLLTFNSIVVSSAIRRAVFDSGVLYNERMRHGYEDWEFFIHACSERRFRAKPLGAAVHLYRKWGFSMIASANGINARLLEQIRSERPIYDDPEQLLDLKRHESPFFSVAAQTPELERSLSVQSLRDWTLADASGRVVRDGDLLAFRERLGRALLVSCDDAALGRALADDPHLLDKIARVIESHRPSLLWLATTSDASSAYPGHIVRPDNMGATPSLRGAGFVLPLENLFAGPPLRATSDGLIADVATAAGAVAGHNLLSVIVGHGDVDQGFAIPRSFVPHPEKHTRSLAMRARLKESARYGSRALRTLIGEHAHDVLRKTGVARTLRQRVAGEALPYPPTQRPSLKAAFQRIRPGPVDPARFREPRHATAVWAIATEPALRPAAERSDSRAVLIAVPWIVQGGADRALLDLLRGLTSLAPDVRKYVVTTLPCRMASAQELLPAIDGVFSLPDHAPHDASGFLVELANRFGADTLLVSNSTAAFDSLPALKRAHPLRVVAHVHGFEIDATTGALGGHPAYVASNYNGLIDQYVTISSGVAHKLSSRFYVSPSKVRTVYLGIDVPRYARARRERFTGEPIKLLWLGRFSEEKDPLMALEVAAALQKRLRGRFRLQMVGGGPLEEQVRKMCDKRSLQHVVEFAGTTDNPVPTYTRADAVLMTSRFEGIPLVVYEAMAAGLPVIAPRKNTSIDEVLSEDTGFLVNDQADPREYVDAVARMLSDRDDARTRAARMVALAEQYGLERYAREMIDALYPPPREDRARETR